MASNQSPPDSGLLGEELTAQWLRSQNWLILHQRWRCRWGELDLIAQQKPLPATSNAPPTLAFIEVKTRSKGNWDADGLLAITPKKQAKIWKTAQFFLASYPGLAELPCRFDVALVTCQRLTRQPQQNHPMDASAFFNPNLLVHLGQPVRVADYQLVLQEYLVAAFGL